MSLWINTNEPKVPRFEPSPAFYSQDYAVPGPVAARMLAAQAIVDRMTHALHHLTTTRMGTEESQNYMEATWHAIEVIVRPFAGASAATKPSTRGTEAPTSVPSPDSSSEKESSSNTKPAVSRSMSKRVAAMAAKPAGDPPFDV